MKRPAPHPLRLVAEQSPDSLAHLAGGLVGERHRQDARRVDAMVLDEPGNARRENASFPRARAGEDEHRSLKMEYSLALRRVEPGKGLSFFRDCRVG